MSDASEAVLAKLKQQFPKIETAPGNNTKPAKQDIVVLPVHPPAIAEVAGQIKSSLRRDSILVSLAPKFTLAKLSELLGGFQRIARVIPNAPCIVNAGFSPAAFSPGLSTDECQMVAGTFTALGECPTVDEAKLEAYALLTGMGPTYFWFQLYELRNVAQSCGLPPDEAQAALEKMLMGAMKAMTATGMSASEVMDLIPVKPLNEMEASVAEMYRTRLTALFQKIKP